MEAVVTKEDIERRCTDAITAAVPEGHIRDVMIGCVRAQINTVALKIPAFIPPTGILMVDDEHRKIGDFLPHIMALTGQDVNFILYTDQGLDWLLAEIRRKYHDITLMDSVLTPRTEPKLVGSCLVKQCRIDEPNRLFIGFSGGSENRQVFEDANAPFVLKTDPRSTIPQLEKVLRSLRPLDIPTS